MRTVLACMLLTNLLVGKPMAQVTEVSNGGCNHTSEYHEVLFTTCREVRQYGRIAVVHTIVDQYERECGSISQRGSQEATDALRALLLEFASASAASGAYDKAIGILQNIVSIWNNTDDTVRADVASAIARIADLYVRQGRFEEAEKQLANARIEVNAIHDPVQACYALIEIELTLLQIYSYKQQHPKVREQLDVLARLVKQSSASSPDDQQTALDESYLAVARASLANNLGNHKEARQSATAAYEQITRLLEQDPKNNFLLSARLDARLERVIALKKLGDKEYGAEALAAANDAYILVAHDPDVVMSLVAACYAWLEYSESAVVQNKTAGSKHFEIAKQHVEMLAGLYPSDPAVIKIKEQLVLSKAGRTAKDEWRKGL